MTELDLWIMAAALVVSIGGGWMNSMLHRRKQKK